MPRRKSLSDRDVLEKAFSLVRRIGPDALTFQALAGATGLSASTLVQRFRTKPDLVRASLLHAWDALDAETARLDSTEPMTPDGAISLLVGLSDYGDIQTYAEGLLLLREDLRDPVLRARGAAWKATLTAALDRRFAASHSAPPDIGLMLASQWQGSLLWWGFEPAVPVERAVETALRALLRALELD